MRKPLCIGVQQLVEIVRALSYQRTHNGQILILDEPTAALTAREADPLMSWLRDLRTAGTTCIYVSHRMDDVFSLCDRVTVLRNGSTASAKVMSETTPCEVVELKVGRSISDKPNGLAKPTDDARIAREFIDLTVGLPGTTRTSPWPGPDERLAVFKVSLTVREGEVVAIAGATPVEQNLSLPWLASTDVMGPEVRLGLVDENAEVLMPIRRIEALRELDPGTATEEASVEFSTSAAVPCGQTRS